MQTCVMPSTPPISMDSTSFPATSTLSVQRLKCSICKNRERVIKNLLAPIRDEYDFILIDCSPISGTHYSKLADSSRQRHHSCSVRILCPGRHQQVAQHDKDYQEQAQHQARDRRLPAYHVRQPSASGQPDLRRGEAPLPGVGVQDRHPAQREAQRESKPRTSRHPLRHRVDTAPRTTWHWQKKLSTRTHKVRRKSEERLTTY